MAETPQAALSAEFQAISWGHTRIRCSQNQTNYVSGPLLACVSSFAQPGLHIQESTHLLRQLMCLS